MENRLTVKGTELYLIPVSCESVLALSSRNPQHIFLCLNFYVMLSFNFQELCLIFPDALSVELRWFPQKAISQCKHMCYVSRTISQGK